MTALPLAGIRVIDLTIWFQGPVAGQQLADFGAEVIHVERPQGGDLGRGVRSIKAVPVGDWNQYFGVINRNKKSLAVDLNTSAGREVMTRLVLESDVFLTNVGEDNLAKWQLTYDELRATNPRLVYAIASGYGQFGGVKKPSFDMTVQALTGIMSRLGEPGEPPIYLGMGSGDAVGGLFTALGIMLALHQRRRTGTGQLVNGSLYGAQLFLAAPTFQPYLATGNDAYAQQRSRRDAQNPLWNTYPTKECWVFLCLENTDKNWQRLCETLEDEDASEDDRFVTAAGRTRHAGALVTLLDERLARRPSADWLERWRAAAIPAGAVHNLADLVADEQAWSNDYLVKTYSDEVQREVTVRGLPIGMSKTPGSVRRLGPELGQHTEEILTETLGYTWEEVVELKEQRAIL
jgi:crotonobetainyl-CoA:carnitine CoA-transferase CaiB-like acyl-CoA transferase